MQKDCSVIILAAGNSSRMGRLKFTLTLPDGITFIENIVKQYAEFGCREIIVVVNISGKKYLDEHPMKDITIALNQHPEFERFYSIKAGLSKVKINYPVFIHNADNPFASKQVLNTLFNNRAEADFIKPVFKSKGGHPIFISNKIARDINSNNNFDIHLNDFLRNYSCRKIEVDDEKILINVNTVNDYLKL